MSNGVISYPKSGRTWLRVMLDELNVQAHFTHALSDHQHARPLNEFSTKPANDHDRVLFLFRDPRDATVSAYHHVTNRYEPEKRYSGTLSSFIRDPGHGIARAAGFNLMWLELASQDNRFLVISYEHLLLDTPYCLTSIAKWLGEDRPRHTIVSAVKKSSFEQMQKREIRGDFDHKFNGALSGAQTDNLNSLKCRKGKAGSFLDELSEQDIDYAEDILLSLNYRARLKGFFERCNAIDYSTLSFAH